MGLWSPSSHTSPPEYSSTAVVIEGRTYRLSLSDHELLRSLGITWNEPQNESTPQPDPST